MKTAAIIAMALLACWLASPLDGAQAQEPCTNVLTGEVVPAPGPYPICCPDPALCDYQDPLAEEYRDAVKDWVILLRPYVYCEFTNYVVSISIQRAKR